jgi:hypothetical protein
MAKTLEQQNTLPRLKPLNHILASLMVMTSSSKIETTHGLPKISLSLHKRG